MGFHLYLGLSKKGSEGKWVRVEKDNGVSELDKKTYLGLEDRLGVRRGGRPEKHSGVGGGARTLV